MILHTSISVIADTRLSAEQIDFLVGDREYTHPPDSDHLLRVPLRAPRRITRKRRDVRASAHSSPLP